MPPIAIAAALVGGGIASGIANNRANTVKSSSTQTPIWGEDFAPLKSDLLASIRNRMANPLEAAAPFKNAINRRFQQLPNRVATSLAQRGMLRSGQLGANLKGVEFERQNALSDLEGRIDQSTLDLAMRLLGMGRGVEQQGSKQYPGNKLGGAISGGSSGLGGAYGLGLFSGGEAGSSGDGADLIWV